MKEGSVLECSSVLEGAGRTLMLVIEEREEERGG